MGLLFRLSTRQMLFSNIMYNHLLFLDNRSLYLLMYVLTCFAAEFYDVKI